MIHRLQGGEPHHRSKTKISQNTYVAPNSPESSMARLRKRNRHKGTTQLKRLLDRNGTYHRLRLVSQPVDSISLRLRSSGRRLHSRAFSYWLSSARKRVVWNHLYRPTLLIHGSMAQRRIQVFVQRAYQGHIRFEGVHVLKRGDGQKGSGFDVPLVPKFPCRF